MTINKNAGRQEIIAGRVDIDYTDIDVAGEFDAMNLPEGAIVVGGAFYSGFSGVSDVVIQIEDKDGNLIGGPLDGTFGAGWVDLSPDGTKLTVPGFVKVTTTGNASAGSGYLYVEYVVAGRAAFSEG